MRTVSIVAVVAIATSLAFSQSKPSPRNDADERGSESSVAGLAPTADDRGPTTTSTTNDQSPTTCFAIRAYVFSKPTTPAAAPQPIGTTDCVHQSKRELKRVKQPEPAKLLR